MINEAQDFREKIMQVALNRSDLYQLLAIAFRDPTKELVEGLISGTYRDDVVDCVNWLNADSTIFDEAILALEQLSQDLADHDPDNVLHDLKIEYFRLFIGAKGPIVSPYQTVYCDPRDGMGSTVLFTSPTAIATEKAYKNSGVSLVKEQNEPPDHIATEMEFLMYLCAQEAMAWKNGDLELAKRRRLQEREFIDEFVGKWIFTFCHQVINESNHAAYRTTASLAQAFIQVELGTYVPGN